MISELINVGTEILIGDILNTNAKYISKELATIGFNMYYHTTVGDNPNRLKSALELSLSRSDVIILTGGLGPTQDDLTKETLAQLLNVEMVFDQESHDTLLKFFVNSSNVTQNNYKQAYIPRGSTIIPNNNGTAPGILLEKDDKIVILLPGPPREMIPMFEETVLPLLVSKCETKFFSNYYKVASIGESTLEDMLLDLINGQSNPTIATYAKVGDVLLRVTANAKTYEEAKILLDKYDVIIKERLGDNIYANEDISLHEVIANTLIKRELTISIAESCTGGLIVSKLTEIPGISSSLHSGIVCYSNQAKTKFLGVSEDTLSNYGSVSEKTATEMLLGLYEQTKSDITIVTTGIAGPSGGSIEKPVGLVYIGILYKNQSVVEKHQLSGSRERIQLKATNIAFNLIRKTINE
ncbi:competence/damage-inducible protein A [Alkalibaculum sp. M08DMB]|uniref:Putative competence-damage inducible protein n=1 Tax=Alkalibaculum sporogenes TaxID=2655001 RepID=A0A6A7K9T2_9FIRM|nr:competence/damage-inducible protein A [Alkalibaculum sporogenes]MPW25813.1 competence/damage-inducible protein A [Alkalibaculum sporogenes]